jgi:hypothetical protein
MKAQIRDPARAPHDQGVVAARKLTTPNPHEQEVETRTWWLFVAVVLGFVGCYALLTVHLVLEATSTNSWMLAWMAVPAAFFIASGLALFVGTDLSPRERLATTSAALLGYSPSTTSAGRPPE